MPNYKIHDTVAVIAAPVLLTTIYLPTNDIVLASTITGTFLFSNYYLSPDLDIDSIMNRRWGFMRFIWYPYKKLFSHRSLWTHSGPLSATIRAIYLSLWLVPPVILFNLIIPLHLTLCLYIGMILADTLHSLLDKLL